MPGFDAGSAVEKLEYDFTTAEGPDGRPLEGKGFVPEPSQATIDTFFRELRAPAAELGVPITDDPKEAAAALVGQPDDVLEKLATASIDALAGLCAGSPSREEIEALPPRVRNAFFGWLVGELTDPTVSNRGTSA